MKRLPYKLPLICLFALLLRLFALQFIQHPGIGDPNHYYNLGLRLAEGHGFTIDYIWQYNNPPDSIVHPEDHWMPLSGLLAAIPISLLGESVRTALLPFILIGTLLPALAYAAARQFGCAEDASLFCAAASAALPEFVLNSVRTDTTIINTFLLCASLLLLIRGIRSGRPLAYAGSGATAGLAYLTRSDSALLFPAYLLVFWLAARRWHCAVNWRYALLIPAAAAIVVTPWIARNLQALGRPTPSGLNSMFFLTTQIDHYAYGRDFSLQTMLNSQAIPQLIGKRLFELAAAFKLMYTTLDVFLPVAVAGGFLLLLGARDRQCWQAFAPTLILLIGFLIAYPLLIPLKSQSGSFKKAYLSLIPTLLPLAAYALERAVADRRLRAGVMILAVGLMSANAVELVRADARVTNAYAATMSQVAAAARALPDTNGDGQIILMAQDPFMLRFFGLSSVMIPAEDRDTVLAVARRYGVDYLMMPPDRPSLDPIYLGQETDPRFEPVQSVPGTPVVLYRLELG